MAPGATDSLRSAVLTAILAIGISGLVVCVLVVLLAGLRTGLGTALTSRCSGECPGVMLVPRQARLRANPCPVRSNPNPADPRHSPTLPCCTTGKGSAPDPCAFTTLRALVGLLNVVVWFLLLAVVVVLAATAVLYGLSGERCAAVFPVCASAFAAVLEQRSTRLLPPAPIISADVPPCLSPRPFDSRH